MDRRPSKIIMFLFKCFSYVCFCTMICLFHVFCSGHVVVPCLSRQCVSSLNGNVRLNHHFDGFTTFRVVSSRSMSVICKIAISKSVKETSRLLLVFLLQFSEFQIFLAISLVAGNKQ